MVTWLTLCTLNNWPHGYSSSMEMSLLLPPGIRNERNICFASCILQCLFNQPLYRKVLADLGVSHTPTRVDYLIYILLKISRDKAFEQLLKQEKGKNTHRMCEIHKRHQKAMSYSMLATIERLENCAYRISSESKPGEFYTVQTIQLACTCKTKCQYCETSHMYSCTCLDACTNTTVCKHMHLVHMENKPNDMDVSNQEIDQSDFCFNEVETSSIPLSLVKSGVDSMNKKIEHRIMDIQGHCVKCNTLQKVYSLLGTVLEQFRQDTKSRKRKQPSHMMSKIQPRFFSTRKKRKTLERAINKPSLTETLSTQTRLKTLRQTSVVFVSPKRTRIAKKRKTSTGYHVLYVTCGCIHLALTTVAVMGTHQSISACIVHDLFPYTSKQLARARALFSGSALHTKGTWARSRTGISRSSAHHIRNANFLPLVACLRLAPRPLSCHL